MSWETYWGLKLVAVALALTLTLIVWVVSRALRPPVEIEQPLVVESIDAAPVPQWWDWECVISRARITHEPAFEPVGSINLFMEDHGVHRWTSEPKSSDLLIVRGTGKKPPWPWEENR